jgi:hypothetical protein
VGKVIKLTQCYASEQAIERQASQLREVLHRMGLEARQRAVDEPPRLVRAVLAQL